MDQVINTGQSCIFSGGPDHLAVDIIALNIRLYLYHRSDPVLRPPHHTSACAAIRFFQFSARKLRFMPGAILAAIMAASIGKVPLPQNGSTRIRSAFHGVSMISADASVSEIGAFAGQLPVAALMQRFACRIQPDHRLVLHHKNTDRIARSSPP